MERHIAITGMLKATPATEGDKRFVYIEASNESLDPQGDIILASALKESAPYYLKYGNLDLDHITQIGMKAGIKDYHFYEVGVPVDVNSSGKKTFVKGEIFSGEGDHIKLANDFWKSITAQQPIQRWYPSVGGSVMAREPQMDTKGNKIHRVSKVRWTNIGFSKTPVNPDVPEVSAIPLSTFSKCWSADGFDLEKALEAGYGTDSANLGGGGALREQSREGQILNYWDFRDRVSGDITGKRMQEPTAKNLVAWSQKHYGMNASLASEYVDRFLADLSIHLKRAKS